MIELLHHLLAGSATSHPARPAVVDDDRVLTYRELDAWSSRVARALVDGGVRPGDRVGIFLDKSIEAVVAIYGVLKSGACYVPCDPYAPVARIVAIATDCEMRVMCTATDKAHVWQHIAAPHSPIRHLVLLGGRIEAGEHLAGLAATGVSTTSPETIAQYADTPPETDALPHDLAYILYTSGSTGRPKGVMLTHANSLAFVDWIVGELRLTASDRLSSHAPFHFDLSILDLFAASACGAATCIVPARASVFPAELAEFMRAARMTIWYSVPSVLSMLVQRGGLRPGDLADLRACLFAGEVFPTRFLRTLMTLLPGVRFGNLYGPTETNVCTAYWLTDPPLDDRDIPIGSAIAGVETFLIPDDPSTGTPIGSIGELCVRGSTVARGYWNDPDRTAARFIPDPRGATGGLVYRTGDVVERLDDGHYLFLGRRDNQIKSRGYRVELDEIEAVLRRLGTVVEVAVVAVPDRMVTNLIKACVVVEPGVSRRDLRRHCQRFLPPQMIPDIFELVAELSKTSTGKIDRNALVGQPTETGAP